MALLEVEDLDVFYGQIHAVSGASLVVREGEIVVVVGANGAGKSSLMNALSGVVKTSAGRVEFAGRDITDLGAHQIARAGLIQVPEGRRIFGPLTVQENLLVGAYTCRDRGRLRAELDRVFAMFPILAERRSVAAGLLSGGEQQMLAFGRALLAQPKMLLIDEPSMGLSPAMVDLVIGVVRQITTQGISILMVEQNAAAAFSVADRAYVLEQGSVVLQGSVSQVTSDPRVTEAFLGIA